MSTKEKSGERAKNRPPIPTLFVGPASVNASRSSLHLERPSSSRAPLERTKSALNQQTRIDTSSNAGKADTLLPFSPSHAIGSPLSASSSRIPQFEQQQKQERNEALWAEMQNTLEEVELSAATTGTHVFGAAHSKALHELRTAQIALAQAWARSETEEEKGGAVENKQSKKLVQEGSTVAADVLDSTPTDKKIQEREGTPESVKSQLEDETENDIALAKKRREANDRYFQVVNSAVQDVVAKLEEVAKAMKGVEQESKEIWGDKDSIETESVR